MYEYMHAVIVRVNIILMAEQLLETGSIQEQILKQMNIFNIRKRIGCLLLMNAGM